MKIINYGHACFKIIDDDISLILDPYRDGSVPGLNLSKELDANYAFKSHDHYDHDALNKVKIIRNDKSLNMMEIDLPHDDANGAKRGRSIARLFKFSDYSICHMGDIGDVKAVINCDALKGVDIVLCPINGFYTISAEDAIHLKEKMSWKILIPMHYEYNGTGYPDGGQINIFKKKITNILEVEDEVEIDQSVFKFNSIIFKSYKRGV